MNIIKIKCEMCGYDKCKSSLHIHHKDSNHENNDISNIIVLCANCHFELHTKNIKSRLAKSKCHELKEKLQELISLHNIALKSYRKENEKLQRQMISRAVR